MHSMSRVDPAAHQRASAAVMAARRPSGDQFGALLGGHFATPGSPLGTHPGAGALTCANARRTPAWDAVFNDAAASWRNTLERRSHDRVVDYTGNAAGLECLDRLRLTTDGN